MSCHSSGITSFIISLKSIPCPVFTGKRCQRSSSIGTSSRSSQRGHIPGLRRSEIGLARPLRSSLRRLAPCHRAEARSPRRLRIWRRIESNDSRTDCGFDRSFRTPQCVHQMIVLDQATKVFCPGLQSLSLSLRCLLFITTKFKNM